MNTKPKTDRKLKVEVAGDSFYGGTFPRIRIQGKWLAALGFKPSGHVRIHSRVRGELIMKFVEEAEAADQRVMKI